ncbi:MAG: hypothetical protein ACRED9_02195 [Caulobacteraceae bacterium]
MARAEARGGLDGRAGGAKEWEKIVDLLEWRRISETPTAWRHRYEAHVGLLLEDLASRDEAAAAIQAGLALIGAPRRRAFLRAPLVASRLLAVRLGESFDPGPIAASLMAELTLAGKTEPGPSSGWTALGDRFVDSAAPRRGERLAGTSVRVDLAGPTEFRTAAAVLRRTSAAEWRAARPKLSEAIRAMRAVAAAFALWRESIDVLALRSSLEESRFSSISLAHNARVSLMVDVHETKCTRPVLVEALVHEAIHSFIFMREAMTGSLVSDARSVIEITSPWTGRRLFLSGFAHACFVWWGVLNFWTRSMASGNWSDAECRPQLERARKGFAARPVSSLGREARDRLSAATARALEQIEVRGARAAQIS